MVGAFDANTRVLVKALKAPGTVVGLCEDMTDNDYMATPVYHVRLDIPVSFDGNMVDLVHAAETAVVRLPPTVAVCGLGDIVKWRPGNRWEMVIGKVTATYEDEAGGHYFVADINGTLWELDANQGTIFIVKRETEGTEKIPL